ncbi:MFS transporter [Lactovum odontotermitis]
MNITFVFASLSYMVLFAASVSMVPLYNIYVKSIQLQTAEMTLATVFYFGGCALALLFLPGLANHLGRKPMGYIALLLGIIAMIGMINANSHWMIIFARLVLGIACGISANVLSVLIIESGIYQKKAVVNVIAGSMMYIGIGLGALLSGALEQISQSLAFDSYWILIILLLICLVGLLFGAETLAARSYKGMLKSMRPRVAIPHEARAIILPSFFILFTIWAMGGYFQSYSSLLELHIFKQSGSLVSALILVAYMLCNSIGITMGERFVSRIKGKKAGVVLYVLFVGLLALSLPLNSILLCIVGVLGSGIGMGIAYSNTLQSLLSLAKPAERAGLLSFFFLAAYGGAALVTFVSGQLSHFLSFNAITLMFFVWLAIFGIIALILNSEDKKEGFES